MSSFLRTPPGGVLSLGALQNYSFLLVDELFEVLSTEDMQELFLET